jgi:hypothetical protein
MPMKKHEMLYVFYRKLPLYDLSSHKHKFVKVESIKPNCYGPINDYEKQAYSPALPTTILREECESMYGKEKGKVFIYDEEGKLRNSETRYDPPLPTSVITTELYSQKGEARELYRNESGQYDPALPTSIIKEEPTDIFLSQHNTAYGNNIHFHQPEQRNGESIYDPPLPNSILEIKSEKGKHATQKPTALIEWCLKYYSKEGDTVLDPTMGSGSTGVACKKMNRKFIGIEKDKEIYDVAVKRNI